MQDVARLRNRKRDIWMCRTNGDVRVETLVYPYKGVSTRQRFPYILYFTEETLVTRSENN